MPYEYRKLSPKEREEIVYYRSERGYPLHAPPHPFRGAGAYLISAANFEHEAIMKAPKRRMEFEVLLLKAMKEIADEIVGFAQSLSYPALYSVVGSCVCGSQTIAWSDLSRVEY